MIQLPGYNKYNFIHLCGTIMIMVVIHVQFLKAQLFPGLEGEALADAIRNENTPLQLLNDTQVKDTLYAKVFIENDLFRNDRK